MPQFFNPASQDESISIFEAQKSAPSFVEQKINIINFRDETVGFTSKTIAPRRSLSMNSYGYEQHLRKHQCEIFDLTISEANATTKDTPEQKSGHSCKHIIQNNFLRVISLCALFGILYFGLKIERKGSIYNLVYLN